MTNPMPNVLLCENGKGWCVESLHETYGPMESEVEVNRYADLIHRVFAVRSQVACTDELCG